MKEIKVSVTGHRELIHSEEEITEQFLTFLEKIKTDSGINSKIIVNTGMALGFDLLIAEICLRKGIEYNAILPFADHLKTNELFIVLKDAAKETIIINDGPYAKWKYITRDHWLVNNCSNLFAYLVKPGGGGTRQTVDYAIKQKKVPITYFKIEEEYE